MSEDSARKRLLEYFIKNVGKAIHRDKLAEIANVHDWARVIRSLRQEGYKIKHSKPCYILEEKEKSNIGNVRISINNKLRYQVLHRDNSTCQRCGRTPSLDKVKLQIDHKIPVEWGGTNDIENLWVLCADCNGGKKHFFSDLDSTIMREVMKEESGYKKLVRFFQLSPNKHVEPITLSVISGIRDWTRTLRLIRSQEKMKIDWFAKTDQYPQGSYKYKL